MILRKRAIENSNFIVNQKLGDAHIYVSDIKDGDNYIAKKIFYLSSKLRGTAQYWSRKANELRFLVNSTSMKLMGSHLISVLGVVQNFPSNL